MTEVNFEKLGRECEIVLKISQISEDAKTKIKHAVENQPQIRLRLDGVVMVSNLSRALKLFYELDDEELGFLIEKLKRENYIKVVSYAGSICYKLVNIY